MNIGKNMAKLEAATRELNGESDRLTEEYEQAEDAMEHRHPLGAVDHDVSPLWVDPFEVASSAVATDNYGKLRPDLADISLRNGQTSVVQRTVEQVRAAVEQAIDGITLRTESVVS